MFEVALADVAKNPSMVADPEVMIGSSPGTDAAGTGGVTTERMEVPVESPVKVLLFKFFLVGDGLVDVFKVDVQVVEDLVDPLFLLVVHGLVLVLDVLGAVLEVDVQEVLVERFVVLVLDLLFTEGFEAADGLGWNSCFRQAQACKVLGSQSLGLKQDSTYFGWLGFLHVVWPW